VLLLDTFKLVVLHIEHMDVSYDSRVPKVVEGIVNNKTGDAAGVEYSMVSVLDTWAIVVGGWVRTCVERGAINSLVFAFCPLIDDSIVD